MDFLLFIILGGIAGWIASIFAGTDSEQGPLGDIVAGIIGAFLGGWIFSFFGQPGVTGFNWWSLFVAIIGAFVAIVIWKALSRG